MDHVHEHPLRNVAKNVVMVSYDQEGSGTKNLELVKQFGFTTFDFADLDKQVPGLYGIDLQ